MSELAARGHRVTAYEPRNGWSAESLVENEGEEALYGFRDVYPDLEIEMYDPEAVLVDGSLERYLDGVDLTLVHEWNDPPLVAAIGVARRQNHAMRLLFHDTHHRTVTAPGEIARYDLTGYDGVLAFGESVRQRYESAGWGDRAWTWHEAADTRVFYPRLHREIEGDLVWIGNWGDDERSAELHTYLIDPVRQLNLRARVYGVRYPAEAQEELSAACIDYKGWVPNYSAPDIFSGFRMTIHVPRRPYVEALPGVPTIRVFEALACGIPLISAPWMDSENLFGDGCFLRVNDGEESRQAMRSICEDAALGAELARRGLEVIWERHTCAHRVDELIEFYEKIRPAEAVQ